MVGTITFDAENHVYALDGVEVPSVTQILEDVGLTAYHDIPLRVLERKSQIGTLAHQACEFLDDDDLDWGTIPESVQPYVKGYELFKRESGFEPAILERRMVANLNGMLYGMTPDRVGLLNGRPHILDLKCAAQQQKCWGIQLAGYALGLPKPRTANSYQRTVIHLLPDGRYRLIPFSDETDYQVFQWALALTWWKRNAGY